jgi:hypothetical protein
MISRIFIPFRGHLRVRSSHECVLPGPGPLPIRAGLSGSPHEARVSAAERRFDAFPTSTTSACMGSFVASMSQRISLGCTPRCSPRQFHYRLGAKDRQQNPVEGDLGCAASCASPTNSPQPPTRPLSKCCNDSESCATYGALPPWVFAGAPCLLRLIRPR